MNYKKILVAVMATITCVYAWADTVFEAPDANRICLGSKTIKVSMIIKNEEYKIDCHLYGVLEGKFIVAPKPCYWTSFGKDRLFLIDLKSSTEGVWSGLDQDVIDLNGAITLDDITDSTTINEDFLGGQMTNWVQDGKRYLLATNQLSQRGYFWRLELAEYPDGGNNYKKLYVSKATITGMVGSNINWSNTQIKMLDTYDFKSIAKLDASTKKCEIRDKLVALAFTGPTPEVGMQEKAADRLLIGYLDIPHNWFVIEDVSYVPYTKTDNAGYMTDSYTQVGGIVHTPDTHANLGVALTLVSRGTNVGSPLVYTLLGYTLQRNGTEMSQDGGPLLKFSSYKKVAYISVPLGQTRPNAAEDYLWYPGAQVVIDTNNDVLVVPSDPVGRGDIDHKWTAADVTVGKIKEDTELAEKLTKGMKRKVDRPNETERQKVYSEALIDNCQVMAVVYGWPLWVNTPEQKATPTLSIGQMIGRVQSSTLTNGMSVSIETGVAGKVGPVDVKSTIKSTYENKFEEGESKSTSFTSKAELPVDDCDKMERTSTGGVVFFVRNNPVITKCGVLETLNGMPCYVDGYNDCAFSMIFVSMAINPAHQAWEISTFSTLKPDELIVEENWETVRHTKYALFSDGLVPRPPSKISAVNTDERRDALMTMMQWERDNRIDLLLSGAGGAITPYVDAAGKTGVNYYESNAKNSISLTVAEDKWTNETHAWSTGYNWEIKGVGPYTKGEITYKGSVAFLSKGSKSESVVITIPSNPMDSVPLGWGAWNIDVPRLKSYLKNTTGLLRPNYIPTWCWDQDQSFILFMPYADVAKVL